MSEATPEEPRRGYQRSTSGLVAGLLVCLGIAVVIFALQLFKHADSDNPPEAVDPAPALAEARNEAEFRVLTPASLPEGARVTVADWEPTSAGQDFERWQLVVVTKDDKAIALEQGTGPSDAFIDSFTVADEPGPAVMIDGQPWLTLTSDHAVEHAFIRVDKEVTTMVTGTAEPAELIAFVESLGYEPDQP